MFEGDSASVDEGPSGGSSVRRPESKDPHLHEQQFLLLIIRPSVKWTVSVFPAANVPVSIICPKYLKIMI